MVLQMGWWGESHVGGVANVRLERVLEVERMCVKCECKCGSIFVGIWRM